MIDTHAHLDMEPFHGDLEEVLERARMVGVETIVTIGTDLESSRKAVDLAGRFDGVLATVGVHPHEVARMSDGELSALRDLSRNPTVLAFGEIGLDYYYLHSPREIQITRFVDQIRLAKALGLPIVVHSRDAKDDLLKILADEDAAHVGGILHCFTGDMETAEAVLEMGFYLSFSGILTFPKADALRAVARMVPKNRLLIETDAPYLSPVPVRGQRNEPAFVRHTLAVLSEILNLSVTYVDSLTTENARRALRLPTSSR